MNSGKAFLGVLMGVAVGATLGILFAPAKGSKTRKKISKKKDEYADDLHEKFNEFADRIVEKFETVSNKASRIVNNVKRNAEEVEAEVISSVS